MTAKKKPEPTPSKYDSIIITEYARYEKDCGLKIGDHKVWCRVLDRQDENLKEMLSQGYDVQAVLITDLVREMLAEQKVEIQGMLNEHKEQIFARIDQMEKSIAEMRCVVNQTEIDVQKLKRINSWWMLALRGAGWTTLGYLIVRWFHGAWNG
jgi:hypothetical protein